MGQASSSRKSLFRLLRRDTDASRNDSEQDQIGKSLRSILQFAYASALVPIFYGVAVGTSNWQSVTVITAGLAIGGASMMIGSILGFLFALPRARRTEDADVNQREGYRANTNLTDIADWFTKILVGVGLTQLGTLATRLGELATFLAPSLSANPQETDTARAVATMLILFYVLIGFLYTYLWTRLTLPRLLRWAEEHNLLGQPTPPAPTKTPETPLSGGRQP